MNSSDSKTHKPLPETKKFNYNYELIINPTKDEHYPERYKAVLLLNGGISKAWEHYPNGVGIESILNQVSDEVDCFADGKLKLTYHSRV